MKRVLWLSLVAVLISSCTGFSTLSEEETNKIIETPIFKPFATQKALDNCDLYDVGIGVADITEHPSGQIQGGYVEGRQTTAGIHTRQKVRSFIIGQPDEKRVVFLIVDDWAVTVEMRESLADILRTGIVKDRNGNEVSILNDNGNSFYNINNIMMTASHTHNGVMGDAQRRQYNIPAGGYNEKLMNITVRGCEAAIAEAHQRIQPCTIEFSKGDLTGKYNVSKNRSIRPHLNNPDSIVGVTPEEFNNLNADEQEAVRNDPNATDKNMYLLRFRSKAGKEIGALNWFSIHSTSISATNQMISGDNKGVSQQMFEAMMSSNSVESDDFIAAFATSALGDVGSSRTIYHYDKFGYKLSEEIENVTFSARAQASRAMQLFTKPQIAVNGDVGFAMQYTSMDKVKLSDEYAFQPDVFAPTTLPPASGWSMSAGSEIHRAPFPGAYEGMTTENGAKMPLIGFARSLLVYYRNLDTKNDLARIIAPPKAFKEMHGIKPVLLASGNALPSWIDNDLPLQVFKIGNIAVISTVFETTSVSGLRMRNRVKAAFKAQGIDIAEVVYAGNTNGYASYMATPEEFLLQHYEGASTNFGINQLPACEQELVRLVGKLSKNETGRVPGDPDWVVAAPDMLEYNQIIRVKNKLPRDRVPSGKKFGEQVKPMCKSEWKADEVLTCEFYSNNLNSDIYHNSSLFYIQRFSEQADGWITCATDDSFTTNFNWKKKTANYSTAEVIWRIPQGTRGGKYRIMVQGAFRQSKKTVIPYSGLSQEFSLIEETPQAFTVAENGKTISITNETAVKADMLVIRLKESFGDAVTAAEIVFDDGTRYPIQNIGADDNQKILYFPDEDISSVTLNILEVSSENYKPEFEIFELGDSIVESTVKSFALFCE